MVISTGRYDTKWCPKPKHVVDVYTLLKPPFVITSCYCFVSRKDLTRAEKIFTYSEDSPRRTTKGTRWSSPAWGPSTSSTNGLVLLELALALLAAPFGHEEEKGNRKRKGTNGRRFLGFLPSEDRRPDGLSITFPQGTGMGAMHFQPSSS